MSPSSASRVSSATESSCERRRPRRSRARSRSRGGRAQTPTPRSSPPTPTRRARARGRDRHHPRVRRRGGMPRGGMRAGERERGGGVARASRLRQAREKRAGRAVGGHVASSEYGQGRGASYDEVFGLDEDDRRGASKQTWPRKMTESPSVHLRPGSAFAVAAPARAGRRAEGDARRKHGAARRRRRRCRGGPRGTRARVCGVVAAGIKGRARVRPLTRHRIAN